MTDVLALRIVDALEDDLNNNVAGLVAHQTVLYKRPIIVLPEDCPLLCIWLLGKEFAPRTTNSYQSIVSVGISWQEEAVESVETLRDDPELARRALRVVSAIEDRIRALSFASISTGEHLNIEGTALPEAYDLWCARLDYLVPEATETGFVEGYAMTVNVAVTERG